MFLEDVEANPVIWQEFIESRPAFLLLLLLKTENDKR